MNKPGNIETNFSNGLSCGSCRVCIYSNTIKTPPKPTPDDVEKVIYMLRPKTFIAWLLDVLGINSALTPKQITESVYKSHKIVESFSNDNVNCQRYQVPRVVPADYICGDFVEIHHQTT